MENALDIMADSAEAIAAATETPPTAEQQPDGEDAGQQEERRKLYAQEVMDLIDEAERRGYRRGIEEARKKAVNGSQGMWEEPGVAYDEPLDTGVGILRCIRPGVWDD